MALARVSPENAAETVRDQVRGFSETVDAAGRAPALVKLRENADELLALVESGTVEVEVLLLGDLHPQWTGTLAQWLGLEAESIVDLATGEKEEERRPVDLQRNCSVVRLRSRMQGRGRQAGERVAPVLVVARGSKESPGQEWMEALIAEVKNRPLTLMVAPKESDWAQAIAGLGSRDDWVCKIVEIETLHTKNLEESFGRPPLQQAGRMAGLWSASRALASMHGAFAAALENEGRGMRSKRASLEQQMAAKGSGSGGNPTEVLGDVRSYLQKKFDTFTKTSAARMGELVATHDGILTNKLDARIDAFEDFDYEKKPKIFVLTIPKQIQDGLLDEASRSLTDVGREDLLRMRELFREVETHLENLIESKGAPPVTLHFDHMSERHLTNLVDRSVGFNRPYQSEITRRGPMDYFMAARRYQMVFFMVFSAFGLSFIRSYREFTIPMGVVLLSFGLVNVYNGARKQSAETVAKELDKAREGMRNDLKRSLGEVQKGWDQAISRHLSEQQNNALDLVETTVKSITDQVAREAAADKEILQKQLKTLDASQRKVTEGVKKSSASAADLETLSQQLIVFFTSIMTPDAGAAPAAPGMPAGIPPAAAAGAAKPGMPKEAAEALKKLEAMKSGGAATPARPGAAAAGTARPGAARPGAERPGAARPGAARPGAGAGQKEKAEDPFAKLRKKASLKPGGASSKRPPLGSRNKPKPGSSD